MKMTDNTILITGGGSGIGRALAEAFHTKGNHVIIAGRRQAVLDEVTAAHPGMSSATLDIADADAVKAFAAKITDDFPELNVVIHNAGVMKREVVGHDDVPTAEEEIAINLLGPIRLNSALLPFLKDKTASAVLTVSSGLAFMPRADFATYCATKAAIHSYTQSIRWQLQNTSVQVIEVAPPYVQTELTGEHQATDPNAMPLQDYINETMSILETTPDVTEVLVERVKFQRTAESSGEYADRFEQINERLAVEAIQA